MIGKMIDVLLLGDIDFVIADEYVATSAGGIVIYKPESSLSSLGSPIIGSL